MIWLQDEFKWNGELYGHDFLVTDHVNCNWFVKWNFMLCQKQNKKKLEVTYFSKIVHERQNSIWKNVFVYVF